jgi:excinuclease ABC subunit A
VSPAATRSRRPKATTTAEPAGPPPILIEGARTHNLRAINCSIPAGRMTVVTGVSGSGKSSLAFDTLFAEGQRRYVESLSSYARQFIARLPRPDVDRIENIPPAIALEQKNPVRNARSTVGTATEINDYLRLLFAKAGRIVCDTTGEEVRRDSPETAVRTLLARHGGARVQIVAPLALADAAMLRPTLDELVRQGFNRLLLPDGVAEIDDPAFDAAPLAGAAVVPVLVDRMVIRAEDRGRLTEAIETSYRIARGRCMAHVGGLAAPLAFSAELRCIGCTGTCGRVFREPSAQLLNFSSPLGACPTCQGFGRITCRDWQRILPDHSLTIAGGAVAPWRGESGQECVADLRKVAGKLGVRLDTPWADLTDEERDIVINGRGKWYGINGFFDWLEERRYKVQARIMIARYRGYVDCPDCGGTRLRPEALAIRLGGLHIGQVCAMTVSDVLRWVESLELAPDQAAIAERPLAEVRSRLRYLEEVGLGYLTLARQTRTLSGGESQRINLATALGSALTDTLYVLDEPTVGLHPRDTDRLIRVLHRLRDLGNTVVAVEHDPDVIRAADNLIDIGPRAGEQGGQLIYQGPLAGLAKAAPDSLTARFVFGTGAKPRRRALATGQPFGRRQPRGWITIAGACENNLRHVDARIPLGVLCCVTGVSGSGKSTLIKSCLYGNWRRIVHGDAEAEAGRIRELQGIEQVADIVLVDQSPIGRSTRSNPATYLKAYDAIRKLLAGTPEAKTAGITERDFSFNVPGGRCEACEGTGRQTIDMHFLADVSVVCDVCEGRRFQPHVLEIEWQGRNVSQILDLTIDQACEFFAAHKRIVAGLAPMQRVGLGYLRLGQSTATLSGGEAQRLKLAAHLAEAANSHSTLLLFDEPTTGLHPADLDVLANVFQDLVDEGFSLVIIEHNLQLIRRADHVIDLGPEGGADGGTIVFAGTPEELAAHPTSLTGRHLATFVDHATTGAGS